MRTAWKYHHKQRFKSKNEKHIHICGNLRCHFCICCLAASVWKEKRQAEVKSLWKEMLRKKKPMELERNRNEINRNSKALNY